MSSVFGQVFRVSTFGESHGPGVGVVIDGCPPGIPLDISDIRSELDRRRPGQSDIVTPRAEADAPEILSGVLDGLTLGTPIAILVRNTDQRSSAYDEMAVKYRPSHADYTYDAKYGLRAAAGGGRASARETIGRVAAGAIARRVLEHLLPGIQVIAWVDSVADISCSCDPASVTPQLVEATPARCPDPDAAARIISLIKQVRSQGDSLGGTVRCVAHGVPAGLGEPVFDKLEADLAKAILSIPACKGFESGSGFAGSLLRGSQHNDAFIPGPDSSIATRSNNSGGIQGGISNGQPITLRAAFKPTATIMLDQDTVDQLGNPTTLRGKGRHDACVLPRAVPVVEAMTWLVLCDHFLRQRAQRGSAWPATSR